MAEVKTAPKNVTPPATGNGKGKDDKPQETKSQKFVRLANFRVPRCIKYIQDVANLANTQTYEYTPEQRDKLVKAIKDELVMLEKRFEGTQVAAIGFKL
ncbi:MAG TPA: hypothetical protein VH593_10205 [Ktedonobacteraceae bacterium]|jgi:hypothetical protein